ncbi:hypothetical protein [Simiduia litorea]
MKNIIQAISGFYSTTPTRSNMYCNFSNNYYGDQQCISATERSTR